MSTSLASPLRGKQAQEVKTINHVHALFCLRLVWHSLPRCWALHQHMTYTQLLEASRPRHKLTCQIPKKTRKAVSRWMMTFQHLICISPKRTAGKAGAGGGRQRARERRKEHVDLENQDAQAYTRGDLTCYCKTSGEGSGMWPNLAHSLVVCSDLWPFLQRTGQTQTTSPQQWAIDASGLNSDSCALVKKGQERWESWETAVRFSAAQQLYKCSYGNALACRVLFWSFAYLCIHFQLYFFILFIIQSFIYSNLRVTIYSLGCLFVHLLNTSYASLYFLTTRSLAITKNNSISVTVCVAPVLLFLKIISTNIL